MGERCVMKNNVESAPNKDVADNDYTNILVYRVGSGSALA